MQIAPTSGAPATITPQPFPTAVLEAMARGRPLRFSGAEQRVILGLLLAPRPLSAWQLAGWLNRPYCDTKRVVRGLMAFGVLRRGAGGLMVESDPARWLTAVPPGRAADPRSALDLRPEPDWQNGQVLAVCPPLPPRPGT